MTDPLAELAAESPPPATVSDDTVGRWAKTEGWTAAIVVSFVGMILIQEYVAVAYTSVAIAMPEITGHFATTQGAWILTGFILSGAVLSPLVGKFADVVGKRKVLLSVLVVAAVGSLVSATAPSFGVLILGRCLEGTAVAATFLCYSLMRDIYPKRIRTFAISVCLTGSGVITIFVPFLVGNLLDTLGFRGLFWFNLALLVVIFALVSVSTPESPLRKAAKPDVVGGLLIGMGIALVLIAVSQGDAWGWGSTGVIGCFVGGLALLVVFAQWTRRVDEPIVNLSILTFRPILMLVAAASFLYAAFSIATTMLPMVTMSDPDGGFGLGMSATEYSAVGSPYYVSIVASGLIVARFVPILGGRRMLIIGAGLLLMVGLLFPVLNDSYAGLVCIAIAIGLGTGITMASVPNLVVQYSPASDQASVAGNVQILTASFSAVSPVLMFALLTASATVTPEAVVYGEAGYRNAALLIAAFSVCALVLFFTVFSHRIMKTYTGPIELKPRGNATATSS